MLLLFLTACQSGGLVRQPIFRGTPTISSLQLQVLDLQGLGAPAPTVRKLRLGVRVTASGKPIGNVEETLQGSRNGYTEYIEMGHYRVSGGRCTLSSRSEAVAIAGFLVVMEDAQVWSPDCGNLGGGSARREATNIEIVSGRLFPLAVGNKLALRYTLLTDESGRDQGTAQYAEQVEETYEVTERRADYSLEDGRNTGEVFVLRATAMRKGKKKRTYDIVFSTMLGWRIGYVTDLTASPIDWTR